MAALSPTTTTSTSESTTTTIPSHGFFNFACELANCVLSGFRSSVTRSSVLKFNKREPPVFCFVFFVFDNGSGCALSKVYKVFHQHFFCHSVGTTANKDFVTLCYAW